MSNEARELVARFLNGTLKEQELINMFDLKQCNNCEQYHLDENIEHHDIHDKELCEDCVDELCQEWE